MQKNGQDMDNSQNSTMQQIHKKSNQKHENQTRYHCLPILLANHQGFANSPILYTASRHESSEITIDANLVKGIKSYKMTLVFYLAIMLLGIQPK